MLVLKATLLPSLLTVLALAACSTTVPLRTADVQQLSSGQNPTQENAALYKTPIKVHVSLYQDSRSNAPSRAIGDIKETILGLNTNQVVIEDDVADIITAAMKGRFTNAGYQITDSADAQFEVSGTVREFSLNIAGRDELAIVVQTALSDVKNGAVIWSGIVTEKTSRFAGTMGDSKQDVFKYLDAGINTVSQKTVDTITVSLKQAHADLFNQIPLGPPPAPGVTVLATPQPVAAPQSVTMPQPVPLPASAEIPATVAASASGYLSVTTKPPRVKVYVDDVYYGLSPLKFELNAGIHDVRLKADGYKPDSEKVSIRKNETTELEMT